ncbi:hypothetical protein KCP74_18870 [Salmonella enterica subsp. enterica]|nr:hypothetical protein KCP74_18870 [Salmonella enterica subsp. enterica]
MGVALLNINLGHHFQSALYGFSAAVGFSLVVALFAAIRESCRGGCPFVVTRDSIDYRRINVLALWALAVCEGNEYY